MKRNPTKLRWTAFKKGLPVISHLRSSSKGVDSYRNLALEIESSLGPGHDNGRVIAVSGPEAGVGKTLTSLNTAIALAKKGERRVILLEADIWQPSLSSFFAAQARPISTGLSELLKSGDSQSLDNYLFSIWDGGIDVVPAGVADLNADLFTGDKMLELMVTLRSRYQYVVFDCPPFEYSTSRWLANHADCVLAVVQAKRTGKKAIETMLSDLGPRRVIGIVLNKCKDSAHGYKYTRYGYGYGYRSSVDDSVPSPRRRPASGSRPTRL